MDSQINEVDSYAAYILRFVSKYVSISEREFNVFLPFLQVRKFGKREKLVKYGETDNYLNLVVKGLVRKFVLVGKSEKTLQLATEGHIIQSELSFHTRVPSTLVIEAIEPSVIVSMQYENVQQVLAKVSAAEKLARQIMTYLFIKKDKKYFDQLNYTTRERFLAYIQSHPHMLQRVPQKILASYLDIKPETFSRLKHLLKK